MDAEMDKISALLEEFPYVSVVSSNYHFNFSLQDTEYPGCIYQDRMPTVRDPIHYQYLYVKKNIDNTKII